MFESGPSARPFYRIEKDGLQMPGPWVLRKACLLVPSPLGWTGPGKFEAVGPNEIGLLNFKTHMRRGSAN